ncbi:DnaJ domain-containing protein [Halocatena halophila]|uniref:DnaJ domain-containing protein n=1 Tax=Halocatena halophila TaxID=2814576 RepID=UPI002ED5759E
MTSSVESAARILGVETDASQEEITAAYREQVKAHHPDHSDDPDAQEKLMAIREARETLLNATSSDRADEGSNQQTTSDRDRSAADDARTNRSQRRQATTRGRASANRSRTDRSRSGSRDRTTTERTQHDRHARRNRRPSERRTRTRQRKLSDVGIEEWTLRSVITSPTVVRLAVGIVLYLAIIALWSGLVGHQPSATHQYGIFIVSIVVSYLAYEGVLISDVGPERALPRFQPAGVPEIWPSLGAHLGGLVLVILIHIRAPAWGAMMIGAVGAGWALVGVVVVGLVLFGRLRGMIIGIIGGLLALGVLFTEYGGSNSVRAWQLETFGSVGPLLPQLSLGPIHLGALFNVALVSIAIGGVLFGTYRLVVILTLFPWIDRYQHGFSIRPAGWNLAVVLPLVTIVWLLLTGTVWNGGIGVSVWSVLTFLFLAPTPLLGLYILRRKFEHNLF